MTCKPMALVDDVVNAFNDYVCDSADAVEQALKAEPALKEKQRAIEQGVDCWQLRLQRSADQSFDEFELRALQQILRVPEGVQEAMEADAVPDDEARIDDEINELVAKLQQAGSRKRKLQRKLAAADRAEAVWESHKTSVQQLAELSPQDAWERLLKGAGQLSRDLEGGNGLLQPVTPGRAGSSALAVAAPPLGASLPARQADPIKTVSVPDLQQLSAMLCM